jgi:hypothetical protein
MRSLAALALACLSTAAAAEPLTGDEFEAFVEGRTLSFALVGSEPYGIEHYHPGRRVTWAWAGTTDCSSGVWEEVAMPGGPAICFTYAHEPDERECWRFFLVGEDLQAEHLDASGAATGLYEVAEAEGELVCAGPGV